MHFQPINLNQLVTQYHTLITTLIPKTVSLSSQLEPNLPNIIGDTGQIQQVILNLILNAAESYEGQIGQVTIQTSFVHQKTPRTSSITHTTLKPGHYVCFTVTDNGCGMNEKTRSQIFSPFFTTKFEGGGLGLAAIKNIVTAHQGIICVDSKPNAGTTFTVWFATTAEHIPNVPTAPLYNKEKRAKLALIIDDEFVIRHALTEILQMQGFNVIEAENGEEGLQVIQENAQKVGLIIMDMIMPKLSGMQLLTKLHQAHFNIPTILLSGYGEKEMIEQIDSMENVYFLQKPVDLQKFVNQLHQILP